MFLDSLSYSPTNRELEKLMNITVYGKNVNLLSFDSADLMEKYLFQLDEKFKAGIQFDDTLIKLHGRLPIKLDFSVRLPARFRDGSFWPTDQLYPRIQGRGPRNPDKFSTPWPFYHQSGFLAIQKLVSSAIITYHMNLDVQDPFEVLLQRFPCPEYRKDNFPPMLDNFLAFIVSFAYTYSVISITKVVTVEKEKQLKESMKIMGLGVWLYWASWFIKSLIFMLISIIIIVFVFKSDYWYADDIPAIFPHSDSALMVLFLVLYACATITFCFMISVFFAKASLATTFVWLIFLLTLLPFTMVLASRGDVSVPLQLFASIFANTAMGLGFSSILKAESMGVGMQWNNLWLNTSPLENILMGQILIMLSFDAILYMLIALYVEAVFPGEYGMPKKWHFIFTDMFKKRRGQVFNKIGADFNDDRSSFEADPENMKAGIEILNLRKEFANRVVVRDINLTMYEDQITVLLGHNGAGKTTTISMLTGMYLPTNGTVVIDGYDIKDNANKARATMGICPQHNILFDDLTVREHVYFYGKLKGLSNLAINQALHETLKGLNFEDKINSKVSTLSGGMKRKLSVAVAFTGNLKIIILDEPTAGMDPSARRALWKFIKMHKAGRTILLTTHFMDEADLLGDRIAIMNNGKISCCGTSFFLKAKYGTGYKLIIAKNEDCDVQEVTAILRSYVANVDVETNVGTELTYLLRKEDSSIFEKVLKHLEDESSKLGINSFGISMTTLEEVFMKVGKQSLDESSISITEKRYANSIELLTGIKLVRNQIYAMFFKRILISARSWRLLLIQIIFCLIFLASNLFVFHESEILSLPSLKLSLDLYKKPVILISTFEDNHQNYTNTMFKILKNYQIYDIGSKDVIEEILYISEHNEILLKNHYIVGAQINEESIIGLFNNYPYHAPPIILNLIMNTILKSHLNFNYEINVYNHPLPLEFDDLVQRNCGRGADNGMIITECLSFMTACYILFYIRERVCSAKHLQLVSGMNIIIFWFVSMLWDWLTFIIFFIIFIIVIICFQQEGIKTFDDINRLIFVCIFFELAMFSIVYVFSLLFKLPSIGFAMIMLIIILGMFCFMLVHILEGIGAKKTANHFNWMMLALPTYSLPGSIDKEIREYCSRKLCHTFVKNCLAQFSDEERCWVLASNLSNRCVNAPPNYYTWNRYGILPEVIFSLITCFLLLFVLFIMETGLFAKNIRGRNVLPISKSNTIDVDVQTENFKVNHLTINQFSKNTVVMRNLTKHYKKVLAVNNLCLAVDRFECFGLLGINGAGKTTTFKMATGDISISSGNVYVNGMDLKRKRKDINKITGYCPQFNGLFDELTSRETIKLFALIRGYKMKHCHRLAENLAIKYDFYQHLDKLVKNLSGGNKRKLNTAVALIGNPIVIYLDEPTAGLDPATKRRIWDQLCKERDSGKCLILTSHSMEECEALCTRLGIMVNGSFKCIGSTQHLKSRFAPGYTLTIKFSKGDEFEDDSAKLNDFILQNCPTAELKDRFQQLVTYNIPDSNTPWSKIFAIMETAKAAFNIEDYSLGQSSLDHVFLLFTDVE